MPTYPTRVDLATKRAAPETSVLRRAGAAVGPVVGPALSWLGQNVLPALATAAAPVVPALDILRRGSVATQAGAADFFEGAMGLNQGAIPRAANSMINPDYVPSTAAVRAAAVPKARVAAPKAATGAAAMPAGLKPIVITPEMEARAEIGAMFDRPHSWDQVRQAVALQPAPVKPATGTNAVAEVGASMAGRWYAQEAAEAQALAATDPEAARAALQKAQQTYASRLATFSRGDPSALAQAGLLVPGDQ